jgi:DNA-binding XRE family transcriptional regulator
LNTQLESALLKRGWSKAKSARLSGLSRAAIANIISGKGCSMLAAYRIAQVLRERVDEIFLPEYVQKQKQKAI